jgi:hypothetical protein
MTLCQNSAKPTVVNTSVPDYSLPARLIRQAEFEEVIGRENICDNVQAALRRAEDVFEKLESTAVLDTK